MKTKPNKNFYELIGEIEDYRTKAGRRPELQLILTTVIMSIMSGCFSLRGMRDFIKKNKKELLETFKPKKDRLPSHQTIGRALQNTDFEKLSVIFKSWANNTVQDKTWVSFDGKAIRGTVEDSGKPYQQFTSLVTAFASHQKKALATGKLNTKKENEISTVRQLIEVMKLKKMYPDTR